MQNTNNNMIIIKQQHIEHLTPTKTPRKKEGKKKPKS